MDRHVTPDSFIWTLWLRIAGLVFAEGRPHSTGPTYLSASSNHPAPLPRAWVHMDLLATFAAGKRHAYGRSQVDVYPCKHTDLYQHNHTLV